MKAMISSLSLAFSLAVAGPAVAAEQKAAAPAAKAEKLTAADADAFIAAAEKDLFDYTVEASQVNWVNSTYLTEDTDAMASRINAVGTEKSVKYALEAAKYANVAGLSADTKRKLDDRLGQSRPALRLGLVHLGNHAAVGFARGLALAGGLDAADAAPALAGLGFDLAHLGFRMMLATVIAECGFSHAVGTRTLGMPIVTRCDFPAGDMPLASCQRNACETSVPLCGRAWGRLQSAILQAG